VGTGESPGGDEEYVLIWGAARLQACKLLGQTEIEAVILKGSNVDFKKAELLENLIRPEMTVLQEAEAAARLVELYEAEAIGTEEPVQTAQVSKGGRGKRGGVSDAARNFGIERTKLNRLLKIAAITPEAKARAGELTKTALLKIAGAPRAEQIAKAEELAKVGPLVTPSEVRRQSKQRTPSKAEATSITKEKEQMTDLGGISHLDAMREHWRSFWQLYDSAENEIRDVFIDQNKLHKEALSAVSGRDHFE
jgi:ParB-like chromosome segregation protein Spo0J